MSKIDLLTANDELGSYPSSHYARGLDEPAMPPIQGAHKTSVCVIGAGFTGLNAALTLAKSGVDVIVLEASRIGFGATGRNGGQIGTGQRVDVEELEKKYGFERAKAMFDIGVAAHDFVVGQCREYMIDMGYQAGVAHAEFDEKSTKHGHIGAEYLASKYGYDKVECIDDMSAHVNSPKYAGGIIDWGAGHGDPLVLARGVAKAAIKAGVKIYENSRVLNFEDGAGTENGIVHADHYVLACNGYLGGLDQEIAKFVMPINNFIVSTEVLGAERAMDLIPQNIAIADSKFVVNYFRRTLDHRLLFGGGESYGYRFPKNLAAKAYAPMLDIFPQLKGVKIENAWGGTLAITMNRLPYMRRRKNIWTASGYSGHGVALASYCGHLIGDAIYGDCPEFDIMASIEHSKFPGGTAARHPLLVAAMLWYQLRDKLGI